MRSNTGILIVEGISLPDPSDMVPSDYDIADSNRNANGIMIAQVIREDVHKLECAWSRLSMSEYNLIRTAIKRKYDLNVKYFCPDKGKQTELKMYVGDRKSPIKAFRTFDGGIPVYKDVTINFIEM